jgi:hypothetical protein
LDFPTPRSIEHYNSFNNAGIAGEESREGYEDVDKSDPVALSEQMFKSTPEEWAAILKTNTTAAYVSGVNASIYDRSTDQLYPAVHRGRFHSSPR